MHRIISSRQYRILMIGLLVISLGILWTLNKRILTNTEYIPVDDFGHYWAAGKLILAGENPYDPALVQTEREAAIGAASDYAVVPIMWTPPWTIPLTIPFGTLPYPASRLMWLLAMITCIMICSDYLWRIYGGERKLIWLVWVCSFLFGPTISVLQKGQITPLILAGTVGFLYSTIRSSKPTQNLDLTAGLWASLITIKPQLFYLFWPILLFWCFKTRRWAVVAGSVVGIAVGVLIAMLFNPNVLFQYLEEVLGNPPIAWATPTTGGYLRVIFGLEKFWLQFIFPILGLVGVIIFWLLRSRKRTVINWDWINDTPFLLFASILTAAYAWTYDQVILLPAILYILAKSAQIPNRKVLWTMVLSLMVINLADLILHRWFDEFWFGWLAPAYLFWYLIGVMLNNKASKQSNYNILFT